MAWRFKASKYKNSAPKIPRKEDWVTEIQAGRLMQSYGNHIKASSFFMVFNTDQSGGCNLGVLPLNARGRQRSDLPTIHAHTDFVSDFDMSPFDTNILATGSCDNTVKIWQLPDPGQPLPKGSLSLDTIQLCVEEQRVENVLWHPTAEDVLAVSSAHRVKLYDVVELKAKQALEDHGNVVQGITWKGDGSLLASSCKDRTIRIYDPRAGSVTQEIKGHSGQKESRVQWLGNKDLLLSTGFSSARLKEVCIWDSRKSGGTPLKSVSLDSSPGVLMPFFDADTNMLFLIGKGVNSLIFWDVTDKEPYVTEAGMDRTEQVKGAAMVPKRAMDVMHGEVNRLILLTKNSIITVPYIVPRKSYREYHADIYPDTAGPEPVMSAQDWFEGENKPVTLMSLDPAKRQPLRMRMHHHMGDSSLSTADGAEKEKEQNSNINQSLQLAGTEKTSKPCEDEWTKSGNLPTEKPCALVKPIMLNGQASCMTTSATESSEVRAAPVAAMADYSSGAAENIPTVTFPSKKPTANVKAFSGVRQSKFKYLKAEPFHKDAHFDNLRNLANNIPGESNIFHANRHFCALPLQGPGGVIAILNASKPERLSDMGRPLLQNGSSVMDFVWDPFNDMKLVVACDDAKIRIWEIPEEGLTETLAEPVNFLKGHTERISLVRFHPLAKDVLASASYDLSVRIWDLLTCTQVLQLSGHPDQIFSLAWSPDGQQCATVCKDGRVRVFEPRSSDEAIKEARGPEGSRGARIFWVLDGKFLGTTGFDRMSIRQVDIYNLENLDQPVHTEMLHTSPSILVPFYDEDSSTLFLTGKGDGAIFAYEVMSTAPYLFALSHCQMEGLHQALSFLPKAICNVQRVEFARAWRLKLNSIELVSFTVPRVKREFFQDDLFPNTKVTWEPVLTSSEWFAGENKLPTKISLRPPDMPLLSEAPSQAPKPVKFESYKEETYMTDEQKKEELLKSMNEKMNQHEGPLAQDLTEGVDSDEWKQTNYCTVLVMSMEVCT